MAGPPPAGQLVVIGASAGGVEALSTLVATLPSEFPAPIVIAQHLDPSRPSHLDEVLQPRSPLPVRTVRDQQVLQPSVVYLVPSDRHVEIEGPLVRVLPDGQGRPLPSIDRLLTSAAEAFGENLVAVILTGLGSDGADGARHVKEQGGTVVIQNPQTASHPEMPLSLAPTTVDIVADLPAIGGLLQDLLTGAYAPMQPDDDRRLRLILDQLRTRTGIDFSSYKEPTLRRRLQRRVLDTGNANLEAYLQYLRRHPDEYQRLASSFLIKVTDFFRDADLFEHLRERVLPELIEHARTRGRGELRLWSAGCATGEEAYSLAILARELLGDELEQFTVRIFATDLDADAVAFARRGVYPASALKNLTPALLERHFTRLDSAYEVAKPVRGLVVFGQHDLGRRAPFPRIDLAVCRNVLIYFTPELQLRTLQLFALALRDGGYLVLGKAETTAPLAEHFALAQPRLKIYRRQGERVVIPPARIRDAVPQPADGGPPPARPALAGMERELAHAHHPPASPSALARAEEVLLELPLGVIVVDRHYDIQSINAEARRLLGIHTPATGEDLVHLARRSLAVPLRTAIDTAWSGTTSRAVYDVDSLPDRPGEPRAIEITAFLHRPASARREAGELAVVLIADTSDGQRERREREAAVRQAEERATRAEALLQEATRTVHQLMAANEELASENVGLRSANEELLITNEEAQAAAEEVETLSEEQQATNEELETLNEELQAAVEELNTTNDDLEARSLELQDQALQLQAEQTRLGAVLASMADAVLVVDATGRPVLTNAAFQDLFGAELPVAEDEAGQPLPLEARPEQRAARGEEVRMQFTLHGTGSARRWFEASGRPLRGEGIEGAVVVIRDITDRSLRQLQEQFLALAGHELRTPLTALQGSLQLLERALPAERLDARARRSIGIALGQARLLGELVQDLTDVVRLQNNTFAVERVPLDLVQVVDTSVELAQPITQQQTIRSEVPSEPTIIRGDARRLQQVVMNLLANAVQHAPGTPTIDVRLRTAAEEAILEVSDQGPGIPRDERERLFSPFYKVARPDRRGLGLGLYIVHEIVAAHAGTIDVESAAGQGTRFVVRLPLAAAEDAAPTRA